MHGRRASTRMGRTLGFCWIARNASRSRHQQRPRRRTAPRVVAHRQHFGPWYRSLFQGQYFLCFFVQYCRSRVVARLYSICLLPWLADDATHSPLLPGLQPSSL